MQQHQSEPQPRSNSQSIHRQQQENQEAKRFLQMMNILTWHIRESLEHQENIFGCLNADEEKKLFQSLEDDSQQIRITAAVFVLYLLYNNPKVLSLVLQSESIENFYDSTQNYIVGGIRRYKLSKKELICKYPALINQVLDFFETVEQRPKSICWSLNRKTGKLSHLSFVNPTQDKISNFNLYSKELIDPKQNIIGISIKLEDPLKRAPSSKHAIKRGDASNHRMYSATSNGSFGSHRRDGR